MSEHVDLPRLDEDDFDGPEPRTPEPSEEPFEPWAREEGVVRRVVHALDDVIDRDDEHEWEGWEKWRSSASG